MIADESYQVRQITAYISAYKVSRCYGGPEEGGWWYDSYEWLKVSIPFRALQDYRWQDGEAEWDPGEWRPHGPPRPADFTAEIQVAAHEFNLHSFFGDDGGRDRYSVIGGPDLVIVIERNPGERGEWPRPRYE